MSVNLGVGRDINNGSQRFWSSAHPSPIGVAGNILYLEISMSQEKEFGIFVGKTIGKGKER